MKKIQQYTIPNGPEMFSTFSMPLPEGSTVLSVSANAKQPVMWVLADPSQPNVLREFVVLESGDEFDDTNLTFVGTVQLHEDRYVLHLFEIDITS